MLTIKLTVRGPWFALLLARRVLPIPLNSDDHDVAALGKGHATRPGGRLKGIAAYFPRSPFNTLYDSQDDLPDTVEFTL